MSRPDLEGAQSPFRELRDQALGQIARFGPSRCSGLAPSWKRRAAFLMRHFCQARCEAMGGESAEGLVAALLSVEAVASMAYGGRVSEAAANALRSHLRGLPEFREDWAREGRFSEACAEHHWWLGYQLARGVRGDLAVAFYQKAPALRQALGEPLAFPETDAQWLSLIEALELQGACGEPEAPQRLLVCEPAAPRGA